MHWKRLRRSQSLHDSPRMTIPNEVLPWGRAELGSGACDTGPLHHRKGPSMSSPDGKCYSLHGFSPKEKDQKTSPTPKKLP